MSHAPFLKSNRYTGLGPRIRGCTWEGALEILNGIGISEYQATILTESTIARETHRGVEVYRGLAIQEKADSEWSDQPIEAIKNLIRFGLVQKGEGTLNYFLTDEGIEVYHVLKPARDINIAAKKTSHKPKAKRQLPLGMREALRADLEEDQRRRFDRRIQKLGMSGRAIRLVRTATPLKVANADGVVSTSYVIGLHETNEWSFDIDLVSLREKGLVMWCLSSKKWILNHFGILLREELDSLDPEKKKRTLQEERSDPENINYDRDGAFLTLKKMSRRWLKSTTNRLTVARHVVDRGGSAIEAFIAGHQEVEEALKSIQALDHKIYKAEPLEPDHTWTVEHQRAQNDIYWLGGPTAFWLNPNAYRNGEFNLLAEDCPTPEWWSPPQPLAKQIKHTSDIVEASLLPPQPVEEAKPMTTLEELSDITSVIIRYDEPVTDYQLLVSEAIQYFVDCGDTIRGFSHEKAMLDWRARNIGRFRTIARKGTETYGELLRRYTLEFPATLERRQHFLDIKEIKRRAQLREVADSARKRIAEKQKLKGNIKVYKRYR